MNSSIQLKKAIPLFVVALACFGLSPGSRAVSPPPDGGYPNQNTAEGTGALHSLTTGYSNTAVGFHGLFDNTTGYLNTTVGSHALAENATGFLNTAIGSQALQRNRNGFENTATGALALLFNTSGAANTAVGVGALQCNTTGDNNTAVGSGALASNRAGIDNIATGVEVLTSNTTGSGNTAIGDFVLLSNTRGGSNTAVGISALFNSTGDSNTALGGSAGFGVTTASNVICIGSDGANVNNSCFIGNIRGVTTANTDAIPVLIDSAGQLGTMSSSRRFKTDIQTMDKASEAILALKPVTFHYKTDKTNRPEFGLIAEAVAKVNPDLVVRDKNGEIYTVRYDAVNAMLLNEFLKEHKKTKKLEATLASLIATVKEQAAQIQKVSAQLEASKPAPRVVNNP